MADRYFAGYTTNTHPPNPTDSIEPMSALSQGQLHKILIDEDTQHVISVEVLFPEGRVCPESKRNRPDREDYAY